MSKVLVRAFDYAAARKSAGRGRLPVLLYSDGSKKILFPDGQLRNVNKKPQGNGKSVRRERIRLRREARESLSTP